MALSDPKPLGFEKKLPFDTERNSLLKSHWRSKYKDPKQQYRVETTYLSCANVTVYVHASSYSYYGTKH
ncbi:hypothetical protein NDU88_001629 [Pleurodeles waltl]|uniref:Uncharacterized protein n=1 Tax=Pleurodeles waltl TaxID=8319 RepID=A0AAV7ML17_PLEWA|nr:hypothetical protein NDU88_001629 [Pleurodeles waltl]